MRKFILFITSIFAIGSLLTACGEKPAPESDSNEEQAEANSEDSAQEEESNEEAIEVDKGLLNVEITIPPSLFEGQNVDEVIAGAKADGVKDVTKNEDGSLTYKMSKSVHEKMMKEAEKGIYDYMEELKTSEDFTSIEDVTANQSFTEFTLVVDQNAYENSFDGFAALGLGIQGLYYQLFDGVDPNKYEVKISVENKDTGEVFDSVIYPDALEEAETK